MWRPNSAGGRGQAERAQAVVQDSKISGYHVGAKGLIRQESNSGEWAGCEVWLTCVSLAIGVCCVGVRALITWPARVPSHFQMVAESIPLQHLLQETEEPLSNTRAIEPEFEAV